MSTYDIKPADYDKILDYFYTHNDNRTTVIAKKLNLVYGYVNFIIDFHLSLKSKPMIDEIILSDKRNKLFGTRVRVSEDGDVHEFISLRSAADFYGVNYASVCQLTAGIRKRTIKHYNKKVLTYEKI